MIAGILRDGRGQHKRENDDSKRTDDKRDGAGRNQLRVLRAVIQIPIFASRSANSLAMRAATGWSAAKRDSSRFARSIADE